MGSLKYKKYDLVIPLLAIYPKECQDIIEALAHPYLL
jgi:hypothetical protein